MYSEYLIVKAESSQELDEQVNKKLSQGWEPFGGVSLCAPAHFEAIIYAQAMVMHREAKEMTHSVEVAKRKQNAE